MKMREAHVVPLSSHAVAILRELHPLTGRGRYLFPGIRTATEPMSENTVNAALRRMGFDKDTMRSEEHTSELQSLMRISYAVFCLKKKKDNKDNNQVHIAN